MNEPPVRAMTPPSEAAAQGASSQIDREEQSDVSEFLERVRRALADRYEVEREIGRGGMAVVFLAHDLQLGRQVAVKVIRPELAQAVGGGSSWGLAALTTCTSITYGGAQCWPDPASPPFDASTPRFDTSTGRFEASTHRFDTSRQQFDARCHPFDAWGTTIRATSLDSKLQLVDSKLHFHGSKRKSTIRSFEEPTRSFGSPVSRRS
jgi:hypothetical protein